MRGYLDPQGPRRESSAGIGAMMALELGRLTAHARASQFQQVGVFVQPQRDGGENGSVFGWVL
jgi:hypothetical protein